MTKLSLCLLFSSLVACSSASTTPTDAGPNASDCSAACTGHSVDAPPPVDAPPLVDANMATPQGDAAADPSALCTDVDAVFSRCYSAACASAVSAECVSTFAPVFSAAFAGALHQCGASAACFEALDPSTACMAPRVRAAAPTSAQMTLGQDFCQACAKAAATTEGGLSCTGHVLSAGSTGRMLPTTLLSMSDAFAEKVYAAHCIAQAVQAYPSDYDNCENTFLNCAYDQMPQVPGACTADAGTTD